MPKIELPPTKSSLRRLKEDLAFAYEGYDLLNQKREILALEIVKRLSEIRRVETGFLEALRALYAAYREAAVAQGADVITLQSGAERRGYFLHLEYTKLIGMRLPQIRAAVKPPHPSATVTATSAAYDAARGEAHASLKVLAEYATLTKAIVMLARELKKVQRRVNALEKIFIPQHEEARKYITDRLEEMEREEVFVKKLISQREGTLALSGG